MNDIKRDEINKLRRDQGRKHGECLNRNCTAAAEFGEWCVVCMIEVHGPAPLQ